MRPLGRTSAAWHALDPESVATHLATDMADGLATHEAERRLARDGPNELPSRASRGALKILIDQFSSSMALVLGVAAVVSLAIGETLDFWAILAILLLNGALGFFQERRARNALEALRTYAAQEARVRRSGRVKVVPGRDLVAGDVVVLEAGNIVPADLRLIDAASMRVQEASLTGESIDVEKDALATWAPDSPLADRTNMAHMGTLIVYGGGRGIVTATGAQTALGTIALAVREAAEEPTPLQRRLRRVGRLLAVAALAIVVLIFGLGMWAGGDVRTVFLTAISLAVAAVPEGLPAVVTIVLALGAQRMYRQRALVRRLSAVEALGSVTVVCSDKTGTLTQNEMKVREVWTSAGAEAADGSFALLLAGALCNDARIPQTSGDDATLGDPTEVALLQAAAAAEVPVGDLGRTWPRTSEVPFSSERKRMTTVHRPTSPVDIAPFSAALGPPSHDAQLVVTKGSLESLLPLCREPPAPAARSVEEGFAADGMRVLAVAARWTFPREARDEASLERELTLLGVVGMADPPRPEAAPSVAKCISAGIRPIMITGDHPQTAQAVGREIGIPLTGPVVTGQELARLNEDELAARAGTTSIYARVDPIHKVSIVNALRANGHVVAMTGDGVNDAPALQKADVGVAMGVTGTDVAKQAADVVLLDDNFATIVAAIEQGRVIFDNIRKFIKYMFTTNSAEIWLMVLAPFMGMPLPLLPLQILWINLVTDGLPALALSAEPAEPDVMRRPPTPPTHGLLAAGVGRHILWVGAFMGLTTVGVGWWYYARGIAYWQTLVFTTLTFLQLAHVLAIRPGRVLLLQGGWRGNPWVWLAVAATTALQLVVVYEPHTATVFRTMPLPFEAWLVVAVTCIVLVSVVEVEKFLNRGRRVPRASA